ncbi:MAG: hypothetical protein ACFUZC_04830 [Chthoniobacteraceae bacterium]
MTCKEWQKMTAEELFMIQSGMKGTDEDRASLHECLRDEGMSFHSASPEANSKIGGILILLMVLGIMSAIGAASYQIGFKNGVKSESQKPEPIETKIARKELSVKLARRELDEAQASQRIAEKWLKTEESDLARLKVP